MWRPVLGRRPLGAGGSRRRERRGHRKHHQHTDNDELRPAGHEWTHPLTEPDRRHAADEEKQAGDHETRDSQPWLRAPLAGDTFGDQDRRPDAPHDVNRQNEKAPVERRTQERQVAVVEQPLADIVRVEQRLREEPLFQQRVRRGEQEHGWPSAAGPSRDLSYEQRPAAVQRDQGDQDGDASDREVAKQELRHERCEHQQEQRRPDSAKQPPHHRFSRKMKTDVNTVYVVARPG